MTRTFFSFLLLLTSALSHAAGLDALSNADAGNALKQALSQGAQQAVASLGKTDGFLGNPKVKIPLPPSVQKVEGMLRTFGMGKQADELVTRMNRAAESAVPLAGPLLLNAVKQLSPNDAVDILKGPEDSATQYFRRTTASPLGEKVLPIVREAIAKVKLAESYDALAGKAAKVGLIKGEDAHLDQYVTGKTLDGLYAMIAEQEKAIRQNPAQATGDLAKKVFGLLR